MSSRTISIVASAIVLVLVVAGVWWLIGWITDEDEVNSGNISRGLVTETEPSDFESAEEVGADGVKQDADGFVPLDNDGGLLDLPSLPDSADAEQVEDAVCTASDELVGHRSRENRSAAFAYIKDHADRIEYEPLVEAVEAMDGFDFYNVSVDEVVEACR